MNIKLSSLNYNFNDEGETNGISVTFTGNEPNGGNYISANISITAEDLGEKNFDDITRKEIESLGKAKLVRLVTPHE